MGWTSKIIIKLGDADRPWWTGGSKQCDRESMEGDNGEVKRGWGDGSEEEEMERERWQLVEKLASRPISSATPFPFFVPTGVHG